MTGGAVKSPHDDLAFWDSAGCQCASRNADMPGSARNRPSMSGDIGLRSKGAAGVVEEGRILLSPGSDVALYVPSVLATLEHRGRRRGDAAPTARFSALRLIHDEDLLHLGPPLALASSPHDHFGQRQIVRA
jgi:hypothetical protein